MARGIRVAGLDKVKRKLKKLPKNIRNRELGKALRAGGKIIKNDAASNAPESSVSVGGKYPVIPGVLKKNIVMRTSSGFKAGQDADVKVRIGVLSDRSGRKTGTDAFYWRFHEFGTSKMPARPFLRPAFEGKKVQALRAIQRKLKSGIQKQAKK